MTANIYFAPADLQDVMSAAGINLRVDDDPPTYLAGAAARAGNKVDLYLSLHYDPVNLAKSDLVKDWAVAIAAMDLANRRGNKPAPGVAQRYDEAMDEMKEVKKGNFQIPGIGRRASLAPKVAKMKSVQRPYNRAVVEVNLNTKAVGNQVSFHQWADAWDRFGLNSAGFLDNAF